MELNDVFTDISTPEVSDSEPEESISAAVVDNSQPSTSGGAGVLADNFAQQKRKMFQVITCPSPNTSYVGLYACVKYQRNVRRKMQKRSYRPKTTNTGVIFSLKRSARWNVRYWIEYWNKKHNLTERTD